MLGSIWITVFETSYLDKFLDEEAFLGENDHSGSLVFYELDSQKLNEPSFTSHLIKNMMFQFGGVAKETCPFLFRAYVGEFNCHHCCKPINKH